MANFTNSYVLIFSLVAAIGFLSYRYLIYPAFLSPLSKIPCAHFSTRISPVWIQWLRYHGRENNAVWAAHQKHGPVVLLAPDEISVNCVENGTRTVYGKAFDKPDYWGQFAMFGHKNQLSTLDAKSHAIRRKRIAKVFAKSYLQNSDDWAAIINVIVQERLLQMLLDIASKNDTPNVIPMLRSVGVDAVTAYMFGISNGTDFVRNSAEGLHYQKMFNETQEDTYTYNPFFYDLFALNRWIKSFEIFRSPPSADTPFYRYGNWGLELCDAAERTRVAEMRDGPTGPGHMPVVYNQMRSAIESEGPPSTADMEHHAKANPGIKPHDMQSYVRLEIASELIDNINATNATLGTALSFAVWELSKRPDLQQDLRSEVFQLTRALSTSSGESRKLMTTQTLKVLEDLPLLNAVTMETLRRHAPVPGVLPRKSPHGVSSQLGKYTEIPGGVRVTAYAYSLHRNENVFPAPEEWRPERWLGSTDSEGHQTDMEQWFWAFGSGVRACSGDVVALQVMKTVLATVYGNFVTSIVDAEGMEQIDGTIGESKGDKLILNFTRV